MRDAIGSTWVFALVISFTLIFSGFLVLALSYSKAFKLKNEITSIIERHEGLTVTNKISTEGSIGVINQYLNNNGYKSKGHCKIGDYATNDFDRRFLTLIKDDNVSEKYYYCISFDSECTHNFTRFSITVFYDFNLPIIGKIGKYAITGQTNEIYKAYIWESGTGNKTVC